MDKRWSRIAVGSCALGMLVLCACSDTPKSAESDAKADAAAAAAGPAVPVPGKTAYWEMYKSAFNWSKDCTPIKLEAKEIPGIKNDNGKAALWEATFTSDSQHQARVFTYAIVAHPPDIYKGVTIGGPIPWSGPNREAMPFQMSQVGVDSDDAFKTAQGDAGKWLKDHPGKEPAVTLQVSAKYQIPTWFIVWGDSKLGYRALINGMNGAAITSK